MEDIEEIIKRTYAGPHAIECAFVEIGQAGPVTIDMGKTGQKIKKACLEHGYTVRRLHKELNIGMQSVYAWFAGSAVPSLDNMYQLSILFEIPMEQMIVESPKITDFCMQLGRTDRKRTAKVIWNYFLMELRSCRAENVRLEDYKFIE